MKDLKGLAIYGGGTIAIILMLVAISRMENIPSNVLGIASILVVVVIPIVLAVKLSKNEREKTGKK